MTSRPIDLQMRYGLAAGNAVSAQGVNIDVIEPAIPSEETYLCRYNPRHTSLVDLSLGTLCASRR